MLAEVGVVLAGPGNALADRAGDTDPSALGRGCGSSIAATEADRARQLSDEEVALGGGLRGAFGVPEGARLLEVVVDLVEAPAVELPPSRRARHPTAVGSALGELLAALPRAEVADLVEVDDSPPALWPRQAVELYGEVRSRVPEPHRPAIESLLATPAPDPGRDPVFTHNDLGIEHVLVDPSSGRVTDVIDWSDAAIADPAHDLGLILRDLGPAGFRAAARHVGDDATLVERAWLHARCAVIEDLAYGLQTGRSEYTAKSRDALGALFNPTGSPRAGSRP